MPDTGYRPPGTVVDDPAWGTQLWPNPNDAKTSNNVYAICLGPLFIPGYSHYLKATNFGFSVPDGATIDGILVEIERKPGAANTVYDARVRIVKDDGTIGTTDKSIGGYWPITEAYYIYGGSSDLWGESWTPAKINDLDFGVVLATYHLAMASAYVDHIRIKVYYTEVALTNIKINISDAWKDVDEIKINVADVWRNVIEIWQNIGDVWKRVF